VAPALALYSPVTSFATGPGPGNGQLDDPGQADILDSNGDLYIADTANDRIEVFTTNGEGGGEYGTQVGTPGPTGLAVDQRTGDVYVADVGGAISKFDRTLEPITAGWTDPGLHGSLSLAVDPSTGDILVADQDNDLIRRFGSDGTALATFAAERPVDLAANSSGEIFVITSNGDVANSCGPSSTVRRFSAVGAEEAPLEGPAVEVPGAVAVDPESDDVVVAGNLNELFCEYGNHPEIAVFEPDGTNKEETRLLGDTMNAAVSGLAVDNGGRLIYAVTKNPEPANEEGGATTVAVVEDVQLPEDAATASADKITPTSATLNGSFTPTASPLACHFEYFGDSGAATSVPCLGEIGSTAGPIPVHADLEGLTPHSNYQFALVLSRGEALDSTADRAFTTTDLAGTDSPLPVTPLQPAATPTPRPTRTGELAAGRSESRSTCSGFGARAKQFSARSKKLRRFARQAGGRGRSSRLLVRAKNLAARAQRASDKAGGCRAALP
jgi:DNA-binding beta-propeller fold protein YncE